MDDTNGRQPYQPVSYLVWSAMEVAQSKTVKVNGLPKESTSKLFRVVAKPQQMGYLGTNELT